ncbi:MAG: hypothetical protein KatS3mg115_0845 [Candidatus Poribacteria bacterium]|nr:MAG: hypothetical protein KatS3mg115_0845 [Candidatus Poribacteria bacterium]
MKRRAALLLPVLLVGWLLTGCAEPVAVPIRVAVPGALDPNRYPRLAVLPFVSAEEELDPEVRHALTQMLRLRLERMEGFIVLGEGVTRSRLRDETIGLKELESREAIQSWGSLLEASALIAGIVHYYTLLQPQQRYVDRYSYELQRYVREVETVFYRSYYLSLELIVYDAKTGEVLYRDTLTNRYDEPQSALGAVWTEVTGTEEVLYELAQQPIRTFVRRLTPHYEYEQRFLAR